MAEFESATPSTAHGAPATERQRAGKSWRASSAIVGLAVAALIIAAALAIGARSGWDSIGSGGINQRLLPKVGEVAPDFQTEDLFGNPVRLSQFRGHPVWLMFWGSWCPPCRAEFPDIQAAYAQLEPKGLRMLGVSLRESPVDAAAYAAENGATFLVLSDPDGRDTGPAYPIFNFPTHIFIDSDGVIRAIVLEDLDTEQAVAEANRLLDTSGGETQPVPAG
jgi:cytochrome c biogenesis protein CcmG/thiol:disulfide interchange protein DsbE